MTTTVTVQVAGHKVLVTERQVTEGQEGHNVNENEVILERQGQTGTFYCVHGINSLVIKELDEASVTEEFLKTGGSARPITDEDIARTNNAG